MKTKINIPIDIDIMNYLYSKKFDTTLRMSYDLKITYSHIHKLLRKLEKLNLLERKKEGRKISIKLTSKGILLGKICNEFERFIKNEL